MKLIRTTISIREDVLAAGQAKADRDYDRSFTAYVERLIREDLEKAGVPLPPASDQPSRRKPGPKPNSKPVSFGAKEAFAKIEKSLRKNL